MRTISVFLYAMESLLPVFRSSRWGSPSLTLVSCRIHSMRSGVMYISLGVGATPAGLIIDSSRDTRISELLCTDDRMDESKIPLAG